MARNDTIIRTLTVAQALVSSRRGVALKVLADKHGFALRNLYRDIAALQAAGFPIDNEDGRYWLREDWRVAGASAIDAEELLALFAARGLAAGIRGTKLGKALERLWMKLATEGGRQGALLPLDAKPWFSVRAPFGINYKPHERAIASLEHALTERKAVRCVYRALSTSEVSERVIEPVQLHWDPALESLYVLAWCRLRGDVRVFAAHRFLSVQRTDESFFPKSEATSERALKKAFRVWRDRNVNAVEVHFQKHLAAEIRERRWSDDQTITDASDGGVVLRFAVAGLAEVERWVLGFGAGARVLGPEGLVERVRAHVGGMSVAYGGRGRATKAVADEGQQVAK